MKLLCSPDCENALNLDPTHLADELISTCRHLEKRCLARSYISTIWKEKSVIQSDLIETANKTLNVQIKSKLLQIKWRGAEIPAATFQRLITFDIMAEYHDIERERAFVAFGYVRMNELFCGH